MVEKDAAASFEDSCHVGRRKECVSRTNERPVLKQTFLEESAFIAISCLDRRPFISEEPVFLDSLYSCPLVVQAVEKGNKSLFLTLCGIAYKVTQLR